MSDNNDTRFSIFTNSLSKQPSGSVTISGYFSLISNPKNSDKASLISARHYHSIGDFDSYKTIKSRVRAFTPHLYFDPNSPKRSIEFASQNSGYIFVEIDVKPNVAGVSPSNSHLFHIKPNQEFKKIVSQDPYLMGVHDSASVFGKVLVFRKKDFIEIRVGDKQNNQLTKDEHEAYVREIGIYLYENYGVVIDPNCIGINQPRYYSQDSKYYFNPNAEPWELKSKLMRESLKSGKHDPKGKSKDVCKKLKEKYDNSVGSTGFKNSLVWEVENNTTNLIDQIKIHFRQYNYYQVSSGERMVGSKLSKSSIGELISSMFKNEGKNHSNLIKFKGDLIQRFELNHLVKFLDIHFYGQYIIDFENYRLEFVNTDVVIRRNINVGEYIKPDDILKSLSKSHILYLIANAGIGKTTAFLELPVSHKILSVPRELIITAKRSDLEKHKFGYHFGGRKPLKSATNIICCHNGLIMAVKNFKKNHPERDFVVCIDEAQLLSESFGAKKNMLNILYLSELVLNDPYASVMMMSGTPSNESHIFGNTKVVVQKFVSSHQKKNDITYDISIISHNKLNEDMSGDLIKKFKEVISKQKSEKKTSHNFIYANIKEESAKAIAETLGYTKYVILRTNNNGSKSVVNFLQKDSFDDTLVFMNSSITTGVDFKQKQIADIINIFMVNQHFDSNTGIQHLIQAPARFRFHKNVRVHSLHNMSVVPTKQMSDDGDDFSITSDYASLKMEMITTSNRVKRVLTSLDIRDKIRKFNLGVKINDICTGVINKDFVKLRGIYYIQSATEKKEIRKNILKACGFNINKLVELVPRVKDLKNYDDADQTIGGLEKELNLDMYNMFFDNDDADILLDHKYYAEFKKIIQEYNDYKKETENMPQSEYSNYN
jgi:hypothetical protein